MMHEQWLLAALEEAWLGRGRCAPNPSVGALLVFEGAVLGKAWHQGAGTPHAERLVLEGVSSQVARGATLYVTLEPCNHWGKTPPCVEYIVQKGIKTVVYAYRDPNPVVSANDTPQLLRDQGIDVLHYPLPEIDAFYQSYTHWLKTNTPWVTVKLAQSLDGKIAGASGARVPLSNDACAVFTHQQRLRTDVILTTARTVHQDDPQLNARIDGILTPKPLAILDTKGTLSPHAQVFQTALHCHIFHEAGRWIEKQTERCTYYPITLTKNGLLDLSEVIAHLGQLGYHDVWVEAGGCLFTALHQEKRVQKTYLYLTPTVLGDNALSAYHDAALFQGASVTWHPMRNNCMASLDWMESSCSPV